MSFLKRLFDRSNPTRDWPERQLVSLTVDLDAGSINGVGLGEPLDRARFLGAGEAFHESIVQFPGVGIALEHKRGLITTFWVVLVRDGCDFEIEPFQGTLRLNHQDFPVSPVVTEAEVVSILGEPVDRNTAHGLTLSYSGVGVEYEIEFTEGGHVAELSVFPEEV